MLKRIAFPVILAAYPLVSFAQISSSAVNAQWTYVDASKEESDEGVHLCAKLDRASIALVPQARQFNGSLCLSNIAAATRMLGIPPLQGNECLYKAAGQATVILSNFKVIPEDEIESRHLEARLVAVKLNRTASSRGWKCGGEGAEPAQTGFKNINEAIKALKKLPDYSTTSLSDFARVDTATGLAELDASNQIYLPPGSTDTLVFYTENNVGRPFLTVMRFNGQTWSDVSAAVLPGHAAKGGGSNYYLDQSGSAPKVRHVRTKKAWQYKDGKFVPEH